MAHTWRTKYGHKIGCMPRRLLRIEFSKQVKRALHGNPWNAKWKAQRCMWWLKTFQ